MAYHLGRLLARHFDYMPYNIEVSPQARKLFEYDIPMQSMSIEQMEAEICDEDILVVNPSFSDHHFGLRLLGRKIMYAQGFRHMLDCHCDLYVSVSSAVQTQLKTRYNIESPIIPAFIQLAKMPKTKPWHERPKGSIAIYAKDASPAHYNLYNHIKKQLEEHAPHINFTQFIDGAKLTRQQFLEALGSSRYLFNLSLTEGFGLIPLEAMAMGTCVIGLDGLAGRDYMRPGENCLTHSMTNLHALVDGTIEAIENETLAQDCAQNGQITAQAYGHGPFKQAWLAQLAHFLQKEPHDA